MSYKDTIEYILKKASESLEEAEVFLLSNKNLSIETFQGEIDKYEIAETGGLSLRGIYNGKMGYSYTEKIDISVTDDLISNVIGSSKYLQADKEYIYKGGEEYKELVNSTGNFEKLDIGEKIKYTLNIENEIEKLDKRVSEKMAYYTEFSSRRYIYNTLGLKLEDEFNGGVISASAVVKEGNRTKTGSSYKLIKSLEDLVEEKIIAREVVEDAISKLNAESIESGLYKVVIENTTFANLLTSFIQIFSSEAVQNGFSLLKDKIGKQIASPIFNLVDDPFIENGFGTQNFDDEGVACKFKEIVEDGILKDFLYNLKTGKKEARSSTGNASRSYKGNIGVSPTNLYVVSGDTDIEDIIENGNGGIYINSLQGLHSGLNPVSGDFSLSAEGFLIENGKLSKPVDQIVVAGNFFELLKNIIDIADDFKFTSNGVVGSPSILINELRISGK